jgi:formylglycine-generating enzyme required for sulfatase activity
LGAGLWGQQDLVGNVMEWILDLFAPSYVDPCTDCAYLSIGSNRVVRGAFAGDIAANLVVWRRLLDDPSTRANIGVRCARAP